VGVCSCGVPLGSRRRGSWLPYICISSCHFLVPFGVVVQAIPPHYLYLLNDPILLNENVFNNEKSKTGLYQIHAGVKIVDRDNTSRYSDLKNTVRMSRY
jgi:hypothetical protein